MEIVAMKSVFETRFQKIGETSEHYGGIRSAPVGGVDDAKEFARKHLIPYFADKCDQEEFVIVTLDTKHRPIRIVRITRGTLDASLVHPREVFRAAIVDCASAMFLAHNHPSGDPTPSPVDRDVTRRLKEVAAIVGIRILDHLIVGDTVCSMAEHGCF
jgi:DNA repair protein RadC